MKEYKFYGGINMNEMNNMENRNQEVYYILVDENILSEKKPSYAVELGKSMVGTVLLSAAVMGGTALAGLAIDKVVIPAAETTLDGIRNAKNRLKDKIRDRKNKEAEDDFEIL